MCVFGWRKAYNYPKGLGNIFCVMSGLVADVLGLIYLVCGMLVLISRLLMFGFSWLERRF